LTKSIWLLSLAVVTVFPSFAALADEETKAESAATPEPPAVEAVKNDLATGIPEIHGFVEGLARGDLTAPGFDFALQQAEIDVIGNWKDTVFYRFDLQFDAYYGEPLLFGNLVEQAIVDWQFYAPAQLKIGFGRFNAPMGFEALDPLDRWLASYSQVFNYLDPFLLTGPRFSGVIGWFDFVLWGSQGWEVLADNNSDKTVGGRLGFKPVDTFGFGIAASYGTELPDPTTPVVGNQKRLGVALDWLAGSFNGFSIGGEVNLRQEGRTAAVGSADPGAGLGIGAMVEFQYRIHEIFALAARYDIINDMDGVVFYMGPKVLSQSVTVGPTFYLYDHLRVQLEYKANFLDQDILAKDNTADLGLTPSQLFQQLRLINGTTAAGAPNTTGLSQTLTLQVIGYF
jgi:hypothetical protein